MTIMSGAELAGRMRAGQSFDGLLEKMIEEASAQVMEEFRRLRQAEPRPAIGAIGDDAIGALMNEAVNDLHSVLSRYEIQGERGEMDRHRTLMALVLAAGALGNVATNFAQAVLDDEDETPPDQRERMVDVLARAERLIGAYAAQNYYNAKHKKRPAPSVEESSEPAE